MDRKLYERVQVVIDQVLAAKDVERGVLLERLVASDTELEREVRSLLAVLSNSNDLHPMSDHRLNEQRRRLDLIIDEPAPSQPKHIERIGDYRILGVLGEGGMGVVYRAVQSMPARDVALKVIDVLRVDDEVARRFKAEAEIQGQLQHPGIVQVYEAGVTHVGHKNRPYIAMELIDGVSLMSYAKHAKLDIVGKLELLIKVADAVGYAHSKGVVHRDLKPENILVLKDGQPKVLDFGIARVTGDATIAAVTMTRDGQLLGTLAFMAPEQLCGDEITPATDVYTLGVIAFELIAQRPPIILDGMSITAAMRLIDIQELPKLRALVPDVGRDIETIVSKCLRSEPEHRYQNATELATDMRRLLADRPITARPPNTMYLTRKYIKRNQVFVGGVIATIFTLVAGIIVASFFAFGQYKVQLLAEANYREARMQQVVLVGNEFQKAADMSLTGDIFGAIEVLETIPKWLQGWGWEMLAAGLPRWMPGDYKFGGVGESHPGATRWLISGQQGPSVMQGIHVLAIADRKLHKWDPLTGTVHVLFPETLFDSLDRAISSNAERVSIGVSAEQGDLFGKKQLLTVETGEREDLSDRFQPDRDRNAVYSADYNVATWRYPHESVESQEQSHTLFIWDEPNGTQSIQLPYRAVPCSILHKIEGVNRYIVFAHGYMNLDELVSEVFIFDSDLCEIVATTGIRHDAWETCPMPERNEIAIGTGMHLTDTAIEIYDIHTLEYIRTLKFEGIAIEYLPKLDALVVQTSDYIKTLVSAVDGRIIQEYFPGSSKEQIGVRIRKSSLMFDEEFLLMVGPTPHRPVLVDTLDPEGGIRPLITVRPFSGDIYNIAVSPGGGLLATYHPLENVLSILDARNGETMWSHIPDSKHFTRVNAHLYFTEGPTLVHTLGWSEEGRSSLVNWDIRTGGAEYSESPEIVVGFSERDPEELSPCQSLNARAVVHPDGKGFVLNRLVSEGRLIYIDDEFKVETDNKMSITEGVSISPDGRHIAIVANGGVEIFDFESRERIAKPVVDGIRFLCASYSPDGKTLAVGTQDGRVMIIETEYYTKLFEFVASPEEILGERYKYVYMLAWSPNGKTLYSGHASGYVRSWGTTRPHEQRQIQAKQIAADERVNMMLEGFVADGLSIKDAGDRLLAVSSLSPEEHAAAEVALVRAWSNAGH